MIDVAKFRVVIEEVKNAAIGQTSLIQKPRPSQTSKRPDAAVGWLTRSAFAIPPRIMRFTA
jgi:hypothetical protein